MAQACAERERLERTVLRRAAEVHAATAALATALAELQAAGGVAGAGIRSLGHWADINLGVASATARRLAKVGERLPELPQVAEAFRTGELSAEKVEAIVEVATPGTDGVFVELARHAALAQVRTICSTYRRVVQEPEEAKERRRQRRGVRQEGEADGLVRIVAYLERDEAALLEAAMAARVEATWRAEREAEEEPSEPSARPPHYAGRQADALVELATESLEHGPQPVVGGQRAEVVVHIDLDLLNGTTDEGRSYIEGVGGVPVSTVERYICDGVVVPLLERLDGVPLDLGRRQATVSRRLRRALNSRDRNRCRFWGCPIARFLQAHHVVPWGAGGPTDMDNLVLLCPLHHRLFHEGAYTIDALGDGEFTFRRPDGTVIEPARLRRTRPTGERAVGSPRARDGGHRLDRFGLDVIVDHLRDAS